MRRFKLHIWSRFLLHCNQRHSLHLNLFDDHEYFQTFRFSFKNKLNTLFARRQSQISYMHAAKWIYAEFCKECIFIFRCKWQNGIFAVNIFILASHVNMHCNSLHLILFLNFKISSIFVKKIRIKCKLRPRWVRMIRIDHYCLISSFLALLDVILCH